MQQLVFPTYLSQTEWKYRTISFNAMSHDISHYDSDQAISESEKQLSAVKTAISENDVLSNTVGDLQSMKLDSVIVLPLPNTLADSQEHSWNEETSIFYKAASNLADTNLKNSLSGLVGNLGSRGRLAGMMSKLFDKIVPDFSPNDIAAYGSHAAGVRKPLIDPGYWQNYSGSRPRRFTMSFDLVPDNSKEAEIIRQIIIMFKKYSSPSIGENGVSLLAPYYWNVQIGNPYISEMMKMDCMVITNISVDYGASGTIQQFTDGFPKYIQLQIQMSEARLTYADNYGSGYNLSEQNSSEISSNSNPDSTKPQKAKNA